MEGLINYFRHTKTRPEVKRCVFPFLFACRQKKEGERVYGEKWRFHENRDSGGDGGMWEEEEEEEEGNGVARFSFSPPRIIMCEYVRLARSPCLRARPRRCRVAVYSTCYLPVAWYFADHTWARSSTLPAKNVEFRALWYMYIFRINSHGTFDQCDCPCLTTSPFLSRKKRVAARRE